MLGACGAERARGGARGVRGGFGLGRVPRDGGGWFARDVSRLRRCMVGAAAGVPGMWLGAIGRIVVRVLCASLARRAPFAISCRAALSSCETRCTVAVVSFQVKLILDVEYTGDDEDIGGEMKNMLVTTRDLQSTDDEVTAMTRVTRGMGSHRR